MRIGIIGSAGSGKSTLASDLSKALGVPLIGDMTLQVLQEQVGKPSWRGIKDTRIRRSIRLEALEKKMKAERENDSFVSDKTVLDYLTYWIQNQAEFETPEQTLSFIESVKGHIPRYDRCIFLPYRNPVDWAEDRSTDAVHNMKVAGLKRGLLTVLGAPVVDADYTFGEDIHAWIARWITPAPGAASVGAVGGSGAVAASDAKAEAGAPTAAPAGEDAPEAEPPAAKPKPKRGKKKG